MIVPGIGISTGIPSSYQELKRKMRMLGLTPSGNIQLDRSRFVSACKKRIEKAEVKKKVVKKKEEDHQLKKMELEKPGAMQQAQLNRIFHDI